MRRAPEAVTDTGANGYVLADTSRKDDCERVAAAARERLGGLDVLCANAGIFPDARLGELTEAEIDTGLGVNLTGTILSVRACLPLLRASGHDGRGLHPGDDRRDPARPARYGRGDRAHRPVPRHRRGRLHQRADDHRDGGQVLPESPEAVS